MFDFINDHYHLLRNWHRECNEKQLTTRFSLSLSSFAIKSRMYYKFEYKKKSANSFETANNKKILFDYSFIRLLIAWWAILYIFEFVIVAFFLSSCFFCMYTRYTHGRTQRYRFSDLYVNLLGYYREPGANRELFTVYFIEFCLLFTYSMAFRLTVSIEFNVHWDTLCAQIAI